MSTLDESFQNTPEDATQEAHELCFDILPEEIPVKFRNPVSGEITEYTLRACTGEERDKLLGKMAGRVRMGRNGQPVGMKNFDGMQADLIHLCLFDKDGERLQIPEIQKWPAGVQTQIYKRAERMCGLHQDAEADAKND